MSKDNKEFEQKIERMKELYKFEPGTYSDPDIIDRDNVKPDPEIIEKSDDGKDGELFPKDARYSKDILQRKEEEPSKDPRLLKDSKH